MGRITIKHGKPPHTISVLAVDDDRQILAVLDMALKDCGYEAVCTSNPFEALANIQSRHFDILLSDLVMPGISGVELLGKTRQIRPETIVILMSAHADIKTACESLDNGAHDFLIKPFSLLSIPIAIERNLQRKWAETTRLVEQRNKVLLESIKALSAAMDAKEHRTGAHSRRIASMSIMIAEYMGLPESEKSTLELAAYMHDIGKIGIKESILLKPDKLSEEEWEEMRAHPDMGSSILSHIEEMADLVEIIRHHHERVDGNGYPDGLSGEDIPLLSRILAVADAFDAMTSDRPYRLALTEEESIRRLRKGTGSQFDAEIVDVLVQILQREKSMAA